MPTSCATSFRWCLASLALFALCALLEAQPAGKTLFVANNVSDSISVFTVNPDGTLGQIAGSPFPAGMDTQALALSADGQYLVATNAGLATVEQILLYRVGATGALTLVPGNPWFTGDGPLDLDMGPTGYVYSPCAGDDQFRVFDVVSDTLVPAPGSPYATADFPLEVDTSVDGPYVYVSHLFGQRITGYSVAGDGALTPLPGSPFITPGTRGLFELIVSPDNRHVYAGMGLDNAVAGLQINGDGTLTNLLGSPFASGATSAVNIAMNPQGTFLFVVHVVSDGVTVMSRNTLTGALTFVPGSFVDIGSDVRKVVADDRFVYVTDESTIDPGVGVMVYSCDDETGLLSLIPGSPFAAGSRPQDMELWLPPRRPGDYDNDGDVDLADHEAFTDCLSGPAECAPKGCDTFDIAPSDCDVDLPDFAAFATVLTQP